MGVLDSLKIPRGDRTDWAAKEYLLIDNVSINKTEIDNAKEGQASLLANLNTKYASKSYVQLAIASPNPSEVVVTDLGIATADNTKIGYSLQVNPAGTGLVFANTYKLGNGTLTTPALSFSTGVNMGLYASTDTNTEILNFKLNGSAVANITTNTVSGVSTFNLGSIVLSSNGAITSGAINATGNIGTTGNIAGVTANVTDVVATGTLSTFAGASIGQLTTTGPAVFIDTVRFNYSPDIVLIPNTFPYSVNNYRLSGYSNIQQAIDCNNSPTFTTSPTTGPRSTGFVQTFIGLGTEEDKATQIFYDGINKRLSMRYFNGTAWDATWVGFAREQGHSNNQFYANDATDVKHVVNLGQMNTAITDAFAAYVPPTTLNSLFIYEDTASQVDTTAGSTGTITIPAGASAQIMLKGSGGPGGPGSAPTVGSATLLTNGLSNIVNINPGDAGSTGTIIIPDTDISYNDFSEVSTAILANTNFADVYIEYMGSSENGSRVGPVANAQYAIVNGPRAELLGAGFGGKAGITPTTRGKVGGAGGWILIKVTNHKATSLVLNYGVGDIGDRVSYTDGATVGTAGGIAVWHSV